MRLRNAFLLLGLCVPALMSCSDQRSPEAGGASADTVVVTDDVAPEAGAERASTVDTSRVPAAENPTRGGDGSQIMLQPLGADALDGVDLPGELACSFADPGGAMLLLARADVVPDGMVHGLMNNNGTVETLGNGRAGGYNDLVDGITLSGKGMTLVLQRGAPRPTGDETTEHAASLKVQRADGAERTYDGTLTCGP